MFGPAHSDRRILITGAGGQLGRDVVAAAGAAGAEALGLGRVELDITEPARVRQVIERWRPDAIVHCAAWTAVDEAEEHRDEAFAINEGGTRNIIAAARESGAYVVSVSTDYVFAGSNSEGYAEGDATDPINAYGASKLAAERATLELDGAAVARTAWLFGASGTNFVRTIARLASDRSELDVVVDQVGCPTYTRHLAGALVECALQRLPGVLHLVGSPTATWFELAQEVVAVLGAECEVRPTSSDSFPRRAARPACSILRVTRSDTPHVGDWRVGVREVIAAMRAADLV